MTSSTDELEILLAERRMLDKKLSERRLLMERVWEEKRDEDERIRAEERELAEADAAGHERMLVARDELHECLRTLEAIERSKLPPPPPLLLRDADRHAVKMEKMRAREAARGIVR
jgi:predicted  nucleic acid-binding Zn-ribbon protein